MKITFDMFRFIVSLSACKISIKILTTCLVIAKLKYLTFDPTLGVRGGIDVFITAMLVNRHWIIISYSENLSDIIVLEKCEFYSTKMANIALTLA